jgi:alpha/beta hydrolase fold
MSCDSWDSNAPFDVVPQPDADDHLNPVACYLGGEGMEKYLTHPYASPLFGDFTGLPPMLVQSGEAEVLRDEITLLAHKATMAGVEVRHELFQDAVRTHLISLHAGCLVVGQVHVFQMFPFLDNAHKSFLSCREFVRNVLPQYQSHSPRVLDSAELERETGNTKSRIVRGDGVEVKTDKSACEEFAEDTNAISEVKDSVDCMGPAEVEAEDLGWEACTAENVQGSSLQPTSPQDRDGTSVDLDTHPAMPLTPPLCTTSDSTLHPTPYLSSPPQPTSYPRRPKGFTISHTSLTSLSPSHTLSATAQHLTQVPYSPRTPCWWPLPVSVTENAIAPAPTIRSRHRAISHPDMVELCRDWAQGPANQTTTYRPDNANATS